MRRVVGHADLYRLLDQRKSRAKDLLDQELFVVGRDIESKHGNLLIRFGARKSRSPIPAIPSLYRYALSRSRYLVLRSFGVLIIEPCRGSIFIERKTFAVRIVRDAGWDSPLWLPRHLPSTRAPRSAADKALASTLLLNAIDWFWRYEEWIHAEFGYRYRLGQMVHWRKKGKAVSHWNLREAWKTLHNGRQAS